jgi:hypothetical protein
MMSKFKKNNTITLNTEPLLNDLNKMLKVGINDLLIDVVNRYEMLEETHNAIMNLPSIKNSFKSASLLEVDNFDNFIEDDNNTNINNMTIPNDIFENDTNNDNYTISDFEPLKIIMEKKIQDEMIKIQASNNEMFNKLIIQIENLKNEINHLKINASKIDKLENENENENENEKENIKLEIVEIVEEVEEGEEGEEGEEVEEGEEGEEVEEGEEGEEGDVKSVETETKNDSDGEEVEEEDEEELFEIEINNKTYCTDDEVNGFIFELDKDGNVGKKVGYLKKCNAFFE